MCCPEAPSLSVAASSMSVLAMLSGYKRDRDMRLMSAVQEVRLVGEIAKTVRPLSAEVFFGFAI